MDTADRARDIHDRVVARKEAQRRRVPTVAARNHERVLARRAERPSTRPRIDIAARLEDLARRIRGR